MDPTITRPVSWLADWQAEAVLRMVVAAGLGALIGLEREHHGRSAGLRTQLLVALGAALAMIVSLHFGRVFAAGSAGIRVDPARLAYGVMAGIGFLGAGAIIHYGTGVRGLTTAASLWCSAAIGLACGFGLFVIAAAATAMVLFALVVLDFVDRLIPVKDARTVILTTSDAGPDTIARYRRMLVASAKKVKVADLAAELSGGQLKVTFRISLPAGQTEALIARLRAEAPELVELSVS